MGSSWALSGNWWIKEKEVLVEEYKLRGQRTEIRGIMFPGMFMRKPDKAAALKQLKSHVAMFGAWVAVIRVTPYVLHFLTAEKEQLKLDL
ncbi:hypothetical protein VNO78_05375 [Psophocarpus tetragonolobus]|uniref:Uncharacterized protein n=1 Tax=Psophocarpus tetragonolobus TaxID=3891 RepID=A0AAN9XRE0_PSOTE